MHDESVSESDRYICLKCHNFSIATVACSDSASAISADEDSDAETINAMESSIPDPDVTLDDNPSAIDDQDPPSNDDSKNAVW